MNFHPIIRAAAKSRSTMIIVLILLALSTLGTAIPEESRTYNVSPRERYLRPSPTSLSEERMPRMLQGGIQATLTSLWEKYFTEEETILPNTGMTDKNVVILVCCGVISIVIM
jgi:hypothetical protein